MNKDAPYVVSGIVRRLFVGLLYSFYDHARLLSILLIMNHLPQIIPFLVCGCILLEGMT